jgi:2-polyprenyl-6-methoxyphenol hydroxylase-like FAD-dependent oxidoreductase
MKKTTEVLVVGGGPVGMYTALALAERGLDVQIVDKDNQGAAHSYGLALHPQSLRLLDELGVARHLLQAGQRIVRQVFYDGEKPAISLDFGVVDDAFPYVLVVPQTALEDVLERALVKRGIRVLRDHQALSVESHPDFVEVEVARMDKASVGYGVAHTEASLDRIYKVRADYVIGADGYESFVRRTQRIPVEKVRATQWFAVFEFPLEMKFTDESRVVLQQTTSSVVWPLGPARGRWGFEVAESHAAPGPQEFGELLAARAPWFGPAPSDLVWSSTVRFEQYLVDRYGQGRVWLVGDAAHGTSPVGVQSMNIGFREAHDLVQRLSATRARSTDRDLLHGYNERWRGEWRSMLGLSTRLASSDDSAAWAARNAERLLSCIPASGHDLRRLLEELHLDLRPAA